MDAARTARPRGRVDEPQIESARSGQGLDADAELIRFTDEVVLEAIASDETFEAIAGRFTSREIIELLLVIGHYMALGRVMATTQVDPEVLDGLVALDSFRQASQG